MVEDLKKSYIIQLAKIKFALGDDKMMIRNEMTGNLYTWKFFQLIETYDDDQKPEMKKDFFTIGQNIFDFGGFVYGGMETGLTYFRQNDGPKILNRAIGFGTQTQAAALKGTVG